MVWDDIQFTKMETHSLGAIPSFVAEVKEEADCPGASEKL